MVSNRSVPLLICGLPEYKVRGLDRSGNGYVNVPNVRSSRSTNIDIDGPPEGARHIDRTCVNLESSCDAMGNSIPGLAAGIIIAMTAQLDVEALVDQFRRKIERDDLTRLSVLPRGKQTVLAGVHRERSLATIRVRGNRSIQFGRCTMCCNLVHWSFRQLTGFPEQDALVQTRGSRRCGRSTDVRQLWRE